MTDASRHHTTGPIAVDGLIFALARALSTLTDEFDAVGIRWRRGEERYDPFDRVAEALYDSFVLSAVRADRRFNGVELRPYGFTGGTWGAHIGVRHPEFGDVGALLELDHRAPSEPFSEVVIDGGQALSRLRIEECRFGVVSDGPELALELSVVD